MSINKDDLRSLTEKVLTKFDMYSESAVILLMGTFAQESRLGEYLFQRGNGPAKGIGQMEAATECDLWSRIIYSDAALCEKMKTICGVDKPNSLHMEGNLVYQIIMTRIKYYSIPAKLPDAKDKNGLALYWKKYYNTHKGKGTVIEFLRNYERFVDDK